MSRGVVHVGVTVADLERAVRFYTEGLGLDVAVRQTSAARYLAVTGYPGVEIATLPRLPSLLDEDFRWGVHVLRSISTEPVPMLNPNSGSVPTSLHHWRNSFVPN